MAFGLLSYKPHLGLLIPFALAAGGYWRTFASAAATATVFALLAVVLLGSETWIAAFDGMARFGDFMLHTYPTPDRLQTLFGLARTLGCSISVALALQAALALAAAALVITVWRTPTPYRMKAALLAACAVLPSPYMFVYDMTILTIAQAFLLAHVLPAEPERPEIYSIAGANLMIALALGMAFPCGLLRGSVADRRGHLAGGTVPRGTGAPWLRRALAGGARGFILGANAFCRRLSAALPTEDEHNNIRLSQQPGQSRPARTAATPRAKATPATQPAQPRLSNTWPSSAAPTRPPRK